MHDTTPLAQPGRSTPDSRQRPLPGAVLALLAAMTLLLAAAPALAQPGAGGRTLRVGPGHELKVPSAAARVARDGDTVEIDGGIYRGDVAVWRQSRLTLRGVNGRPHLIAAGKAAEGKAIWVIKGDDVTVENIEFSGARVSGFAGAGIRSEGPLLRIRNCHFHDNQMGLLAGNFPNNALVITGSRFDHNTVDHERHGHLGHNIYVGRIARFELRDSDVYGAQTGHQVKTRARRSEITGNRIRDFGGASSYLIDVSQGGDARISNNDLFQSALSPNRAAIAYAAEAKDSPWPGVLVVSGNRFTSEGSPGILVRNLSGRDVILSGNELTGRITPLKGPGLVR